MPGSWFTTICPRFGGLDRHTPCLEGRRSSTSKPLSPSHTPTRKLTSNKHSPIYSLNDDVLLNIFYLYRLDIRDEEQAPGIIIARRWEHQRWWYKLAQVSRRWRRLILASPCLLDLQLLCTYGVPVADMLAHSPPLPLTIFYDNRFRAMTAEDEEGARLAITHRDRVRRIALSIPTSNLHILQKLIRTMDEQFPILEHLFISSQREDENLMFPRNFQAPNLCHIDLWLVGFSIRSPILSSTGGLALLETLHISFYSPLPNHDVVDTTTMTHVILPKLRVLSFQGTSSYLEGLISRISTPSLGVLTVIFSNQLTHPIPRLLQFIQATENLVFHTFEVAFDWGSVHLMSIRHQEQQQHPLRFRFECIPFGSQIESAAQILHTLSPVLSGVEKLTLSGSRCVDRTQWRELLRPFSGVKTLDVEYELAWGLSRSLCSENEEMALEILPHLEELGYPGGDINDRDIFIPFRDERQAAGHPVRLASRFQWF